MTGEGLYLMRHDAARQTLEISLMDWSNRLAFLRGAAAADIFAHFTSLADHGIRDAYAYGVVTGLICAATDCSNGTGAAERVTP